MSNMNEIIKEKFGSEELFENKIYEIVHKQFDYLNEIMEQVEGSDKAFMQFIIHSVIENMYFNHMYKSIGPDKFIPWITNNINEFKKNADMLAESTN